MAWIMTDDDSFQHIKANEDGSFDCIEVDLTEAPDDCYVVEGTVDVNTYIKENSEEAECLARMYGYESVQNIRDSMKDFANQIIAEMMFESLTEFRDSVFSGDEASCRRYITGKTE